MKFPGIFAVSVGSLMLIQWALFLLTGNVPELQSAPLSIAFHLAAEFLTAIALIISGIILIKLSPHAKQVFLLSVGMVIYAMINSAGYFAQSGDWIFVAMFAILLVLAAISIYRVTVAKRPSKNS